MSTHTRLLSAVALTLEVALLQTACSDESEASHVLELSDVSLSGLDPAARLDEVAKGQLRTYIDAAEPGDVVTLYAFGNSVTSACEPLVAFLPDEGNSEERDLTKDTLLSGVSAAYDEYVSCVRDTDAGGDPGSGSPVFGAVVEGLSEAQSTRPEVTKVHLITDGCANSEGVRICVEGMTEPGFAAAAIKRLPASLKPDLSDLDVLIVEGLGQGTGMLSDQVSVLRAVFTEYANATGTRVEFR